MKRQIAFLRGINVSGKNKIPMAKLKENFEKLGFQEVKTYLNSGNVIFSSDGGDELVVKDGKCKYQQKTDNQNGKHRQKDSCNVIAL